MIVNIFIYILLIVGLVFVFANSFKYALYRARIQTTVNAVTPKKMKKRNADALEQHLFMLLQVTMGVTQESSVAVFFLASGLFAVVGWFLAILLVPIKFAIAVSIVFAFLPYVLLRTRLQKIQVKQSYEGEFLVAELLNNYKIAHYNIKEAIDLTAVSLQEAPQSKKTLYDLARNLNTAASKDEIKRAVDLFKFSIGTTWASILGSNIYFAQVDGTVITNSLQDLVDAIIKARKTVEANRRENSEGNTILKYLCPAVYILTIAGAIYYYNFTFEKFIYYQFVHDTGAIWFLGMVAAYAGSLIVSAFLTHTKMDI